MQCIKNTFRNIDAWLSSSENREKVIVGALAVFAVAALIRR